MTDLKGAVLVVIITLVLSSMQLAPLLDGKGHGEKVAPIEVADVQSTTAIPGQLLTGMGLRFIENKGQLDNPDVLFYASGDPLSAGLTKDGVTFTFMEEVVREVEPLDRDVVRGMLSFDMRLEGCNDVSPVGIH
ncbi:MAG: hypothetical protein KAQ96_12795, partial [Thermoplasmata archaeon]|nr:hypothetical protein [Thermoplasmata archaeon]